MKNLIMYIKIQQKLYSTFETVVIVRESENSNRINPCIQTLNFLKPHICNGLVNTLCACGQRSDWPKWFWVTQYEFRILTSSRAVIFASFLV